jgi:hypothetical protein
MVVATLLLSGLAALAGSAAASPAPSSIPGAPSGITANVLAPQHNGIYYNNTGSVTVTWQVNKWAYQNWADIKNYTNVNYLGSGGLFKSFYETAGNTSRTFTSVPDNTYVVLVSTTWMNGTTPESNHANAMVVVVNHGQPTVTISSPVNGYMTNQTNFTASFFAPSDPKPIVNYSGRLDKDGTNGTTWVDLGNVTSAFITKMNSPIYTPLAAGSYRLNIRAYDAAGNMSAATPVNFTVGPMVTINVPANGAYLNATKLSGWYASWTPSLVGATPLTSYTVELYNVTTHKPLGSIAPFSNSNRVLINNFTGSTPLTNGTTYDFNVTILSGGKTFKATSTFKVDTKAPIVNITSPKPYPLNVTNKNHFQISWTMVDANGIDHSVIRLGNNTHIFGPYLISGSSGGPFTITNAQVPDGIYWVNVTSFDLANNAGSKNITFNLTATPPVITIGVPQYTANTNVTITWSATDPDKVQLVKMWLKDVTHNVTYAAKNVSLAGPSAAVTKSGQIYAANLTGGVLLANAQWQVYVWANDTFDNNDTQFKNFTVDTVKPVVTIVNPTAFINTGNFTAEWSVTDVAYAAPISLYQARLGYPNGSSTAFVNQSTNTTMDIKKLNGGLALAENLPGESYVFAVRAYDAAGNFNTTLITFVVDTTDPILNVLVPVEGQGFNNKNVTFQWTASDALSGLGYLLVKVDNGTFNFVAATATQYAATNLSEGNHNVTIRAYDKANNLVSVFRNFDVDTVPPQIAITTPANNSYLTDAAVFVAWNASDNRGIVNITVTIDSSMSVGLPASAVNYTTPALLQGWHWINVTVMDNATSTATASVKVFLQLQDPIVAILTPAENAYLNTVNVTMVYLAQDLGDPNSGIAFTEVRLDNGTWINNSANNAFVFRNLTDGPHSLSVRAIDNAGRISAVATRTVNIDTVNPVVTITFPANGEMFNVTHVNATWTTVDASPIAMYEVSTNGVNWTNVGTNLFFDFTALAQGNNTVWVKATDMAGNSNMSSMTFLVDSMAPWVQFVEPTDGQAVASKTILVKWTVVDNTTSVQAVWIWLDGVQMANVTVEQNFTFTALSEGNHVIALQAWDILGNEQIASITVKVDTIAPIIVITQPTQDQFLNTKNVTLTFTVTDGADGSGVAENWFKVDAGDYTSIGVNTTAVMRNLTDGAHFVIVKTMDNVGNVRTAQRNFTVDAVAPTVVGSNPSGRAVNVTDTISVFFSEAMDQATVHFDVNGVSVAPTTWVGNLATYTHSVPLSYAKNYTVTVSGKDLAGNDLTGSRKTFSFATKCLVTGVVKDSNGNPIANATVTLKQGSTEVAQTKTGVDGSYSLAVPEGTYDMTISASGKKDFTQTLTVAVGATNSPVSVSLNPVDNWTWLYILIIVVVVVAILLFLFMRKKKKPVTVPSAPQNLQAVASTGKISLTWQAPTTNGGAGITKYKVYRGSTAGSETSLTEVGNVLSYTDTAVTPGSTYFYKVSAVNSAGEGAKSNEAPSKPFETPKK